MPIFSLTRRAPRCPWRFGILKRSLLLLRYWRRPWVVKLSVWLRLHDRPLWGWLLTSHTFEARIAHALLVLRFACRARVGTIREYAGGHLPVGLKRLRLINQCWWRKMASLSSAWCLSFSAAAHRHLRQVEAKSGQRFFSRGYLMQAWY